jgi:hypothetical protein
MPRFAVNYSVDESALPSTSFLGGERIRMPPRVSFGAVVFVIRGGRRDALDPPA